MSLDSNESRLLPGDGTVKPITNASAALVDAHVHFYPEFTATTFLYSAARNFAAAAQRCGVADYVGILCLTETASEHWFDELLTNARATGSLGEGWHLEELDKGQAVRASHAGAQVIIAPGQQIVTSEDVEVLSLCCATRVGDRLPLVETITAVEALDAITVLPWGFGKWWSTRGKIVRAAYLSNHDHLFLGDNSGRLRSTPRPTLFATAERMGGRVLPGTDPLPFVSEQTKPGIFGCVLRASFSRTTPIDDLRMHLKGGVEPQPYGRLESLFRFVNHQVRMQVRKRGHLGP